MTDPNANATLDLDAYEDSATGELRIKDPVTGAPTPMVVTLAGPEHPERKRLVFARQRRLRATLAKTGKVPVSDPEEDEAEELDTLVACTLGWAGASEAFSRDAVRRLYAKKRWLRDQVAAALQERELFIRACVQA